MIEAFDYGILEIFQQLQNELLTSLMKFFTIIGEGGAVWIAVGIALLFGRQTRKYGVMVLFSLLLCLIFGNGVLKHAVARPRPCWRHPEVPMLIAVPTDYSCPSGHTFASFAASVSLLYWKRKAGLAAFAAAVLIAVSRLYFFVHYPTDILAGAVFGTVLALISIRAVEAMDAWDKKRCGER